MCGVSFGVFRDTRTELLSLQINNNAVSAFNRYPNPLDWGKEIQKNISKRIPNISSVGFTWKDLDSTNLYSANISVKDFNSYSSYQTQDRSLLVMFACEGFYSVWNNNEKKSQILIFSKGEVVNDNSIEQCHDYIELDKLSNERKEQTFRIDILVGYMKQFTYRYQVILEHWYEEEKWIKYDEEKDEVIPELEYLEETLYDGTHDKLHDGGLMKYHEAGKPKKLALKWRIRKSDYSAYFWFEDEEICAIFNKFYGQHPETKTDFIIHIDPIKKKYELSLYRYGLKEPVFIPESAYQLIVFKSGFENYRSKNYNQPTGAWIW